MLIVLTSFKASATNVLDDLIVIKIFKIYQKYQITRKNYVKNKY